MKEIPSHPGYFVTKDGRVYSKKSKIFLKHWYQVGYPTVNFPPRKIRTIHSLVMEAYVGPRPKGYQIAHLDGSTTNNNLNNLKYATAKENNAHKTLHGTMSIGEKHGMSKLDEKTVKFIKENCKTNQRFWAKEIGISQPTISAIIVGRLWRHI